MKIIGIYKITNPKNKIYIGQSVDINARFKSYKRLACKSQAKLLASFNKYGVNSHKFEIIESCIESELCEKEKYYVDLYNTFQSKYGLNIRDGGGNRARLSEEQKTKISESLKGKKHTIERIEANRRAQLGKKMSEETKQKLRDNNVKPNLGKKASIETRIKLSIAHKGQKNRLGKKLTEDQKRRLSEIHSGENHRCFGLKHTIEMKKKISEKLKGHIVSKETREKISQSLKGKKLSQESIMKREATRKINNERRKNEKQNNRDSH